MATFETYFIEDKSTHKEVAGPWFRWIHDAAFCDRIARDMGVMTDGLLVNGHVPVKVDLGETPLKRGGNAVTIDGAFSEATATAATRSSSAPRARRSPSTTRFLIRKPPCARASTSFRR